MMRKRRNRGVSPMIATALMVAITALSSAVLFVMVSEFAGRHDSAPKVAFLPGPGTGTAGQYTIDIAGVDRAEFISDYTVSLVRNYTATQIPATTLSTIPLGNATTLQYRDANLDMKVTVGDRILVSGCSPGSTYEVEFFFFQHIPDIGKSRLHRQHPAPVAFPARHQTAAQF